MENEHFPPSFIELQKFLLSYPEESIGCFSRQMAEYELLQSFIFNGGNHCWNLFLVTSFLHYLDSGKQYVHVDASQLAIMKVKLLDFI